jgi:anaerobic nitric oxide reductase transcription regulator
VPALRERGRDVLLLAGFFLEQNRSRMGLGSLRLTGDAQAALLAYNWPGNVRELEHLIGRSALKALGNCRERPKILSLSAHDLDLPDVTAVVIEAPVEAVPMATGDLRQATEHYQRQIISACLERHQHNWAGAARELGLDRANLGRMAKRLGLK